MGQAIFCQANFAGQIEHLIQPVSINTNCIIFARLNFAATASWRFIT
jgi:hypothetical protein